MIILTIIDKQFPLGDGDAGVAIVGDDNLIGCGLGFDGSGDGVDLQPGIIAVSRENKLFGLAGLLAEGDMMTAAAACSREIGKGDGGITTELGDAAIKKSDGRGRVFTRAYLIANL